MNSSPSYYLICGILTLGVPTVIATEAAYAQKAQGPKTGIHSATSLTAPEIARRTLPAVVMIECENGDETSQASGFLVRPGIVVTNYHVIKDMVKGTIRAVGDQVKGRRKFRITDVLAIDERSDLALLGVLEAKRAVIPTLPLSSVSTSIRTLRNAIVSPFDNHYRTRRAKGAFYADGPEGASLISPAGKQCFSLTCSNDSCGCF